MKKFFIILAIILLSLVVIIVTGAFIFIKTFDFNSLKPYIVSASHNALGRSIDFRDIDAKISLATGIQLELTNLKMGEHPDFGDEDFLSAKQVDLGISIKDFIVNKQIRVLNIEIQSPEINIIRLSDGRINVQTFAEAQKSTPEQSASNGPEGQISTAAIPAILINKIDISGARFKYIDYAIDPELSLELSQIKFSASGISLTQAFPINISAALLSNEPNIFIEGTGQIDLDALNFIFKDAKINCDLSDLSLEELSIMLPQLKQVPLPQELKGRISIGIDQLAVGAAGLSVLQAQGNITGGSISLKELAVPVDKIEAQCVVDTSSIVLDSASLSLGKGKIVFSGGIQDCLTDQTFSFKAKIDSIDIAECIDQKSYPIKSEGLIIGDFEIQGQGFDPATLVPGLKGKSAIEVKEAKLKDINILKLVLNKLAFVPNLAKTLETNLPERFKEKLKNKDTIVTTLKITNIVDKSSILIQPIEMEADGFLFNGNGSVGLDQSYGFEGSFIIPEDLTLKIVEAEPEMEILVDSDKQIKFPLKIIGKGSSVSFYPDISSITTAVIKKKAKEELGKVLDKIFDRDEEEQGVMQESSETEAQENLEETETPSVDTTDTTEEKKDPAEQLIESITDMIFGE